jgi:hypothetical protein
MANNSFTTFTNLLMVILILLYLNFFWTSFGIAIIQFFLYLCRILINLMICIFKILGRSHFSCCCHMIAYLIMLMDAFWCCSSYPGNHVLKCTYWSAVAVSFITIYYGYLVHNTVQHMAVYWSYNFFKFVLKQSVSVRS